MAEIEKNEKFVAEDLMKIGSSPALGITLRQVLEGNTRAVNRITWSPDGRYLAASLMENSIGIWDINRQLPITTLPEHRSHIVDISWSPDGNFLASISADDLLRVWNTKTWGPLPDTKVFALTQSNIRQITWSPDGQSIIGASNGWDIFKWSLMGHKESLIESYHFIISDDLDVYKLTAGPVPSPSRKEFLTGSNDGSINVWDINTGTLLRKFKPYNDACRNITIAPDNLTVASSHGNVIRLSDYLSGNQTFTLEGHTANIYGLCYSHDGRLLASLDNDAIRVWRTDTKELVALVNQSNCYVMRFHPHVLCLALLGNNGINLFDIDYEALLESNDASRSLRYTTAKLSKEPVDTLIGLTFMSALHHLMISDQKMIAPHVVILDEAGQLPVAQGLCTGLSGAGSILMFGDDKQMLPVFSGDLSEEPLATSVFAQLRVSQPQSIQMLNTTYRLNKDLCQTIGSVFYADSTGAPLHPSENAADRKFPERIAEESNEESIHQALSPDTSLVWLQVTTRNCMQFNHEEAQAAARLVATCLNSGMKSSEIAVVTPFRRQATYIRQLIAAQVREGQELPIVDTVERVQGLTVEAVIISFCASETDYIASIAEFLFSPNRLNVEVSRARTKAIVISSPNVFNVLPRSFIGVFSKNLCRTFLNSIS